MTNAKGERFKIAAKRNGEYGEVYYNDVLQLKTTYNKYGNITKEEDKATDTTTLYLYDDVSGRITDNYISGSQTVTENYSYNSYGELSSMTQRAGSMKYYYYDYENNSSRRLKSVSCGMFKETFQYDLQQRYTGRTVKLDNTPNWTESVAYCTYNGYETTLPKSITFTRNGASRKISYSYDLCGNISGITDEGKAVSYTYDKLNRLIREDNEGLGESYYYTYDSKGNITKKEIASYTTGTFPHSSATKKNYTYSGDRLVSYNGESCTYDGVGNPVTYRGKTATWRGRQLLSLGGVTFTYDGKGFRTKKNSSNYSYDCNGRLLVYSPFEFYYDDSGLTGFVYCGTHHFYQKDVQGNITGILDGNGNLVVKYRYDAWGNHKVFDANGNEITSASHIGNINPFRYRGYYYDTETKLYYLQSRYYDPEVGRFLNMDNIAYADPETINGLNLYSYCNNNPVMFTDEAGTMPNWLKWVIGGIVIIGLGIATLATGGAAAGVAGFVVAGAFKGAVIGAVSGALVSGTVEGISSAISGDSFWSGFANGAADGFMSGAIVGGITGAISSGVQVANAAKMWQAGTSARTSTPFKTMQHHYQTHVINEGFAKGNNIVKYTKDAINFANRNASVLKYQVPYNSGLQPFWTWIGKVGMNGQFTSAGKILTFWYVAL